MRSLSSIMGDEGKYHNKLVNIDNEIRSVLESLESVEKNPVECVAKDRDIEKYNHILMELNIQRGAIIDQLQATRSEMREYFKELTGW